MSGSPVEKPEQILALLRNEITNTFAALSQWLARNDTVRSYRSPHEEWNVGQVLEHVAMANHYLMLLIDKGVKKAVRRTDTEKIEHELKNYRLSNPLLEEIGINNSFPWECPPHMRPSGAIPAEDICGMLGEQESRLMDLLGMLQNGEGVLCKTSLSVHSLGRLDVYQYIYFLLKHAQRHIAQMEEIGSEYDASLH
jgi:hypothetical protein